MSQGCVCARDDVGLDARMAHSVGTHQGVYTRRSFRHTRRNPDHTSSMAQTLLSTRPRGSPTSRTASSFTVVATPEDRFGQATYRPPSGKIIFANTPIRRASTARSVKNATTTYGYPRAWRLTWTPSGSGATAAAGSPNNA